MLSGNFGSASSGAYVKTLTDVNGDGVPDFAWMVTQSDGAYIFTSIGKGDGSFEPGTGGLVLSGNFGSASSGAYVKTLTDVDGDGIPDFAWMVTQSDGAYIFISLGNGDGTYQAGIGGLVRAGNFGTATSGAYDKSLVDINDDGVLDFVWMVTQSDGAYIFTSIGNGDGSFQPGTGGLVLSGNFGSASSGAYVKTLTDVNGDGVPDFAWMVTQSDGAYIFTSIGKGDGSFEPGTGGLVLSGNFGSASSGAYVKTLTDVDGDGIPDFAWMVTQSDGAYIFTAKNSSVFMHASGFYAGTGHVTSINYSTLIDPTGSIYQKAVSSYPLASEQYPKYVVSQTSISNGVGGDYVTSYSYENLRSHVLFGSLGYEHMTMLNETTGIATRTTYSQDYANRTTGKILKIETIAAGETFDDLTGIDLSLALTDWDQWRTNGQVTSLTENIWDVKAEAGAAFSVARLSGSLLGTQAECIAGDLTEQDCNSRRYHHQLTKTTVQKWDLDGSFFSTEVNDYLYDDYDQPETITSTLYDVELDDIQGATARRQKVTGNVYKDGGANTADWFFGQIESTDVVVTRPYDTSIPASVRRTEWDYDNATGRKTAERVIDTSTGVVETETLYQGIDSFGNATQTVIKGRGSADRTTNVTFTDDGRLVRTTINAEGHTTTHTYYGYNGDQFVGNHLNTGKVETTTDANGLITHYEYDAFGRTLRTTAFYGTVNPVTTHAAFQWCDDPDVIGSTVPCADKLDVRDGVTVLGKPVYRITQYTDGGAAAYVFIDNVGREVKRASQSLDGRFVVVGNGYDHRGHNTQVCEPMFHDEPNPNDLRYWSFIEYDVLGRAIKTDTPVENPDSPTHTLRLIDTVEYQGLIRISRNNVEGAGGIANTIGQTKTRMEDVMGNLVTVYDNNGDTMPQLTGNQGKRVDYDYDAVGNMVSMTDSQLNVTTIIYDALGRKVEMNDADKGRWLYAYNGFGELIGQTDAKGQTTCTHYDVLGRQTFRGLGTDGAGPIALPSECLTANIEAGDVWIYDDASGKGVGKLSTSYKYSATGSEVSARTELVYDNYGRVEKTYFSPTSDSANAITSGEYYLTESSYDSLHRPDVVVYPGAAFRLGVKTVYNEFGFPVQVRDAGDDTLYQATLSVDAFGNVTKELLGNGVETTRHYDTRSNRLLSIESINQWGVLTGPDIQESSRIIQLLDYKFDVLGNLVARDDHKLGVSETYDYDILNRLRSTHTDMRKDDNGDGVLDSSDTTVKSINTHVIYDELGNIITKSGVGTYTYGTPDNDGRGCLNDFAGPHAVTRITKGIDGGVGGDRRRAYCYDANGNMVSGDGRSINYTYFDKPSYIAKNVAGELYETAIDYGPDRTRYRRVDTTASQTTTYTYVGAYEKVEKSNAHIEERHYIGSAIITITGRTVDSAGTERIRFLHTDHIGSTNVITDESGLAVERFSFDAWGKRRVIDLADLETRFDEVFDAMTDLQRIGVSLDPLGFQSSHTNKGFTGHEQMDGVGLIHMNGRVYDAELGRFISADPFIQDRTDLQNLNRYSYVNNNPLSYTDPSGYFLKKAFKKLTKWVKNVWKATAGKLWAETWRHTKRLLGAIAKVEGLSTVISLVLNFIPGCQFWCSALFNAAMQAAMGVPFGDIAAGFAIGAITAGVPGGGGFWESGLAGELGQAAGGIISHAGTASAVGGMMAGGIAAKAQGGKFIDGVKGAAAGMALSAAANGIGKKMGLISEKTAGTDAPGENGTTQEGSMCLLGGNPINYATGEKYLTLSDISPVGNSRLKLERHYASFANDATAMGNAWRHTYSRKLELFGAADQPHHVVIHRENGEAISFNYVVGEGFVSSSDKGYRLSENAVSDTKLSWALVTPDNVTELYDQYGLLARVEFIGGYQQSLTYEADNRLRSGNTRRLLSVSDSLGYELTFDYDAFGLLERVASNAGKTIRYKYDASDNLIAAYDESFSDTQPLQRYAYSDKRFPQAITGIYNELGERVHYMAYDDLGRATLSALGHRSSADHVVFHPLSEEDLEKGQRRSTVTNALGRQTTYTFDKHKNPIAIEGDATASCIASQQAYDYDYAGRVTSETDWNDVETKYEYNDRGLEVVRIQAAGTDVERRIETRWHTNLRLPVEITEPGKSTELHYSKDGLLLSRVEFDTSTSRSLLAKIFGSYAKRVWQYSYNAQGLVTAIDGPLKGGADTTQFVYNEQGQRIEVINALGHRAKTLAFNAQGLPTLVEDANGVQTRLAYNDRGWLTQKSVATEQGDAITSYTYTGSRVYNGGGRSQPNEGLVDTLRLPNGTTLDYDYDHAGRVTQISNVNGERMTYRYDAAGNRTAETVLSAGGDIVRQQRAVYDELSRLLQAIGADQQATRFRYDANDNQIAKVDPLGHETRYAYDALNRLLSTTDAEGGVVAQSWDASDRLTSVTDQRGLTTEYQYNGFGDKVAQISPDTGKTVFEHDTVGNVIAQIDARGVTTRYQYDLLNRLTVVDHEDDALDIAYVYDGSVGDDGKTEPQGDNLIGRLASVTDASGSTQYAYNTLGQVVEERKVLGDQQYLTAYSYDLAGNLLETRYPTGQVVAYHRDEFGRVDAMLANDQLVVSNLAYDAFGGMNSLRYGNGSQMSISRDRNGRIDHLSLVAANNELYDSSRASNVIYDRHYHYDAASNIVGIDDGIRPEASQQFGVR